MLSGDHQNKADIGANIARDWIDKGDGQMIAQNLEPAVEANAYVMLLDLALGGAGIIRISGTMVREYVQPDRHLPYRVRAFADHLIRFLAEPI